MTINERPRRIILDLAVTLDGFIEGPKGEIDWCIMDSEMGFTDFLNQIDTIFYGRKSYDLWGNIRQKMRYPILKKKCGISFMVNKNSCFLKRKKALIIT